MRLGVADGNRSRTSCTAGEHSMQKAIRTALLTAIRNLYLYYYTSMNAYCVEHRVHRVVTVAFWRTFHHEGKISLAGMSGGARPPPFTNITITSKVAVYAPAEWADTLTLFHLYQYMYSVV
jgi:hypothetical protein